MEAEYKQWLLRAGYDDHQEESPAKTELWNKLSVSEE